jgi:uncharacterized protein YgiM (DUF1202 family)
MATVIVVQPHTATYQQTIHGQIGETVTVGPEDSDFPGWVWCTDKAGTSSWVPKAYLAIEGDFGQLNREYNAKELSVTTGERLTVVDEESSWYLCETEAGLRGWVPMENVKLL